MNQVSRELLIDILGKKKYQKQRSQIEKQIIKNKNRYVLSISSSSGNREETGKFSFVVNIKISKDNLRFLLKQSSLFKDTRSCILPLISFSSEFEKETWSWWNLEEQSSDTKSSPTKPFYTNRQLAQSFFDSLGKEFTKIGFYFINPIFQKTAQSVPASLLPKRSNKMKYFKPIINFYSCDIILSGFIHVGKSKGEGGFLSNDSGSILNTPKLEFVIKGFNRKTKENLFELRRQFPFEKESKKSYKKQVDLKFKEMIESLIYQFSFYKERGSLGLDRLMIALQGNLSYPEKERFMNQVIQKMEGLKNIQIVYLSSQRAIYRVEISKPLSQIIKELKALSLRDFSLQVRKSSGSKLEIYAKTKSK